MIQIDIRNDTNGRWETFKEFPEEYKFKWACGFIPWVKTVKNSKQCCIEAVAEAKTIKGDVRVRDNNGDYLVVWRNGQWLHSVDDLR